MTRAERGRELENCVHDGVMLSTGTPPSGNEDRNETLGTRPKEAIDMKHAKTAEPSAKHEDGRSATLPRREHHDAEPASRISIERPEAASIGVGRQVTVEQADEREGDEDPAVGSILAFTGAQVAATEERDAGQHETDNRQGHPSGV
jgi:hypothetical protein